MSETKNIPLGNHWAATGVPYQSQEVFSDFINDILQEANVVDQRGSWEYLSYELSRFHNIDFIIDQETKFHTVYTSLKLDPRITKKLPLRLKKIIELEGGCEADLVCSFEDVVGVTFFDTRYFFNKSQYKIGNSYEFFLGGLAYKIENFEETTFTDPKNPEKSFVYGKDFAGFMSVVKDGPAAEYGVQGPVHERDLAQDDIYDLNRFHITACRPCNEAPGEEEKNLCFDVYGLNKAIIGQVPQKSDALASVIWLQGKLANDIIS